ncbi:MAG: hypothetical protein EBX49_09320, partial [Synechococcaceae bacterium WB8_1B_136]|nr:hypothetical protein [Synechococcaceae bacterium WB8_1B_136]
THGVKGGAISDFNLAAGGQILKLEATVKKSELTYTPSTGGDPIKASFRPTSGDLQGDVVFNRLLSAPVVSNQSQSLVIGQTGINFALKVNEASSTRADASTVVDLKPLLDGLNTTNKRLAYFVYDTPVAGAAPVATPFTWDPIKKGGARFYDLDGDGTAETVDLTFIDGGYGDKDGAKNGVIVDPSTPGVVDLKPVLTTTSGSSALTVSDPADTASPAAVLLKVALTTKAASVNQIGYVALAATESDTITYEQLRDRGTIILANLENSEAESTDLSRINLERTISVINGQKLVLFEVVDSTLESLLSKNSTIAAMGSSFRTLDLNKTSDNLVLASKGGNSVAVALQDASKQQGLGDLISSKMGESPILDFSGLSGRDLSGTVSIAREATHDTTIGFYRIQRADGAVLDPITNTLVTPGSAGYQAAALSSANLFTGFGALSVDYGATRTDTITSFRDAGLLAPFATVKQTGDTWFSFKLANSDGLEHFRTLGSGSIGLEDFKGGFDQDFDDNIVSFTFKLVPTLA